MNELSDYADHLALALVPGLGPKLTAALLAHFGSAKAALQATAAELMAIPHIGEKLAHAFARALRQVDIRQEVALLQQHGVRPVPLGSPEYPPPLAAIPAPPPLLYCRGQWIDSDINAIGVVGSRHCTPYGRRMTEQLVRDLCHAGFTIVSGLARGIDGIAHRAALAAGGRTIAVLAGGLSAIYPPEHTELAHQIAQCGVIFSETPMTVAPQPGMFPARNRIISGLSRAVIVVEANTKSGALITATHAGEQGREVFAVPGPADSPASAGCHELIRQGARLVRHAADVIDDLKSLPLGDFPSVPPASVPSHPSPTHLFADVAGNAQADVATPVPPRPALDPHQQRLYDALATPRHSDELVRELGVSVSELTGLLFQLELKKLVRKLPGNFYERR
ncbi:MAG: DNA-processing protein DprA [Gemmataceae bacterium]|nr:DNA-processing protein DprA [Gemmata sp.]MDW8199438.1 DNA-processing protein DprA [Gemmataceae bacterium]